MTTRRKKKKQCLPRRRSLRWSRCSSRPAPRRRPRRSVPPSVRTASTSWTSARPTTPRRSPCAATSSRSRSRSTRTGRFTFITKTPPAAELIKKAAGLQKGSGVPHKEKVGKLTKAQVREIADDQVPGPQRQRHRRRDEDRRGHRPLDGRHHRLVGHPNLGHEPAPDLQPTVAGPRWPTPTTPGREENQSCSAARPTARRPRRSTRTSSTPR